MAKDAGTTDDGGKGKGHCLLELDLDSKFPVLGLGWGIKFARRSFVILHIIENPKMFRCIHSLPSGQCIKCTVL
jgi:hypothetical protein